MSKKDRFPSQELDQYMLRFPDGMRDRLKETAKENGRSLNAEIVERLNETLVHDTHFVNDPRGFTYVLSELKDVTEAYNELVRENAWDKAVDENNPIGMKLAEILEEIRKLKGTDE